VPKLFLVLKDGYELDRKAFGAFLNGHIDANKLPKEIELIDSIPRTSNGKLRRALLRERA
jgi:acyl-coenzyme A synthetase/AMP-(fatty) acid ligase